MKLAIKEIKAGESKGLWEVVYRDLNRDLCQGVFHKKELDFQIKWFLKCRPQDEYIGEVQ